MKLHFAQANRLGNREANQDRLSIFEAKTCVLLVVADGMGGHTGGEIAAQITVDTLGKHFQSTAKPVRNPRAFLGLAIEAAHNNVVHARKENPANIDPRTTCIACLLQNKTAIWAHVGDSRLYLIRDNALIERTQDHSYVEDLHQKGQITEDEMLTHPMRNYLTECIGGDRGKPKITFSEYKDMKPNDILLLCSDGFWSQLDQNHLYSISDGTDLDARLDELAGTAEQRFYPQSDNISAIAVRWLENESATKASVKTSGHPENAKNNQEEPDVNDAIDAITTALEQYQDELKS